MSGDYRRPEEVRADLQRVAKMAVDFGIKIIPCSHSKIPLIRDWVKNGSCSPELIKKWFNLPGLKYWGMPTNKFFAVDQDGPNYGQIDRGWLDNNPYSQKTQGGGRHWLFRNPDGKIKNKARFRGDFDIRGSGGQILLYKPIFNECLSPEGVPAPPDELLKLIGNTAKSEDWGKGSRNETLNKLLFADIKKNQGKGIPEILKKAQASGLSEGEIQTTMKSAVGSGVSQLRVVGGSSESRPVSVKPSGGDLVSRYNNFIESLLEVCVSENVLVERTPQFIADFMLEYLEHRVDLGSIQVLIQKNDF